MTLPYSNETTSKNAAEQYNHVVADRLRVLYFLINTPDGATREELETALSIQGNTLRPRVWELLKTKKIVESKNTRLTRAGRKALVLYVSDTHS